MQSLKINPGSLLLLAMILLLALPVQAELFKWVDEEGNIHYSDKKPDDDVESSQIKEKKPETEFQPATSMAGKPIIRPYEKTSRRLHLLDTRYFWKKESEVNRSNKLGAYLVGKGCSSRGAISTPDALINHRSLFPDESRLASRINRVIKGLDYEAEKTDKYRLLERLKKTGGLSLHSEIIELELTSCAPNLRKSERHAKVGSISAHRFTRHRVKLMLAIELRSNRDQDVVFETVVQGSYNGWNQRVSGQEAIETALESAVLTLFSDRSFIAAILVEEEGDSNDRIEFSASPPIKSDPGSKTRALYVTLDSRDWINNSQTPKDIGNMLFGEKCSANKPIPVEVAISNQKWLLIDELLAGRAITSKTRPLGYSVNPASADTLSSLENSGGYSLNAKVVKLSYDACAPAVSASEKYKSFDNKSFRRVSRNRVQLWIEWTLKTDRNRRLLYRGNTMGFAGSLLTDSRGSDVMVEAIGMAAEQLFADKDFVELITLKPRELPQQQVFDTTGDVPAQGILLTDEQKARRLFIVTSSDLWQKLPRNKSIGMYAYGNDCVAYKERLWPEALNEYARLFADAAEVASAQSRIVKSLGFSYQLADEYSVVNLKRKLDGYSLHASIVDLRFDSCAPSINEDVVFSNRKISVSQFKRHRAIVRINWKLLGAQKEELHFETTTRGIADSWLVNSKAPKVLALAVEDAISQLFSKPDFVASLMLEEESDGFISNILSMFDSAEDSDAAPSLASRYVLQAHTAQVLSEMSVLKVGLMEHFYMQGEWPDSLHEIGYSESQFSKNDSIEYLNLQAGGSIVVELSNQFGKNKIIKLSPDSENGDPGMGRWICSSNLDKSVLPQQCEAL